MRTMPVFSFFKSMIGTIAKAQAEKITLRGDVHYLRQSAVPMTSRGRCEANRAVLLKICANAGLRAAGEAEMQIYSYDGFPIRGGVNKGATGNGLSVWL